jgi:hypothetical protein
MEHAHTNFDYLHPPEIEWVIGATRHDLVDEIREIDPGWAFVEPRLTSNPDESESFGDVPPRMESPPRIESDRTQATGTDQPWGTSAHGQGSRVPPSGSGTGVGGASLAGTPAGPGPKNLEVETSGGRPPEGTANQPRGQTGPIADPLRRPGALTDEAPPLPVFDE